MNVIDYKKRLRRIYLEKRNNTSIQEKRTYDQSLNHKLIDLVQASKYKNVHVFLPMKSEPNIFPFIEYMLLNGLRVICPKSLPKGIIENYELSSLKEVERGIFGTSHPRSKYIFNEEIDLIIVPGLAFSQLNERLGYGGGYYDRFLIEKLDTLKLAIAYPFQIVESLPTEDHDVKVNQILLP